jgi:hypothetical protein
MLNRTSTRGLRWNLYTYHSTMCLLASGRLNRLERRGGIKLLRLKLPQTKSLVRGSGLCVRPSEFHSPKFEAELMTIDDRGVVGVSDARVAACTTIHQMDKERWRIAGITSIKCVNARPPHRGNLEKCSTYI